MGGTEDSATIERLWDALADPCALLRQGRRMLLFDDKLLPSPLGTIQFSC